MSYTRLGGPLKITVEHLEGADYPYDRAGPPASWGEGVAHKPIGEAPSVSAVALPVGALALGAFLMATKQKGLGITALLVGTVSAMHMVAQRSA